MKKISRSEKQFIEDGIQINKRIDGREVMEYRGIHLETDVSPSCAGSSRLKLANNDILVGITTEIEEPHLTKPDVGKLEFYVNCSANATPQFEGRGGENLAREIKSVLSKAFSFPSSLDLKSLCIVPGKYAWTLFIDIMILECGGSLLDAASLAVKAALYNTKIPKLSLEKDESSVEINVSDDEYTQLDISNLPCLITLSRIGFTFVVDTCQEEEACSSSRIVLAVTDSGKLLLTQKLGHGSPNPESVLDFIEFGIKTGQDLNRTLMKSLDLENKFLIKNPELKRNSCFSRN